MLLCMTLQLTTKLQSFELCCLLLNAVLLVICVGFCGSTQIVFDIFALKTINTFHSPSLLNVNGAADLFNFKIFIRSCDNLHYYLEENNLLFSLLLNPPC